MRTVTASSKLYRRATPDNYSKEPDSPAKDRETTSTMTLPKDLALLSWELSTKPQKRRMQISFSTTENLCARAAKPADVKITEEEAIRKNLDAISSHRPHPEPSAPALD